MRYTPFKSDLLTIDRMREAEEGASSLGVDMTTLMENAGLSAAYEIDQLYAPCQTLIICGPGNNGGDGLVAARYLLEKGWPVRVMMTTSDNDQLSELNRKAIAGFKGEVIPFSPVGLESAELIVDAIFGIGLSKAISGDISYLIDIINDLDIPIISLDIPSGVNADSGEIVGCAIKATHTITFGRAKVGHYLLPGCLNTGRIIITDIGIPEKLFLGDKISLNHPALWMHHLKEPSPFDNKYTRGCCLVIGSDSMPGATRLSVMAARRAGAGMVFLACDKATYPTYAATAMGEIVSQVESSKDIEDLIKLKKITSILVGPGMTNSKETRAQVLSLLRTGIPIVLDGGALSSFMNEQPSFYEALHPYVILTPHMGEFEKLFPSIAFDGGNKVAKAVSSAKKAGVVVMLKGYDTVISDLDGHVCISTGGEPSLATAGTGDVLSGVIAGLLSGGYNPFTAAQIGSWIHTEAARGLGIGLVAEDLSSEIPRVWKLLYSKYTLAI